MTKAQTEAVIALVKAAIAYSATPSGRANQEVGAEIAALRALADPEPAAESEDEQWHLKYDDLWDEAKRYIEQRDEARAEVERLTRERDTERRLRMEDGYAHINDEVERKRLADALAEARGLLARWVELLDGQTEPLHPLSWQVELAATCMALEGKI